MPESSCVAFTLTQQIKLAALLETARKLSYAHIFESPPETVLEIFQCLERQYGGVGYLHAIGITHEQSEWLRAMLIDY